MAYGEGRLRRRADSGPGHKLAAPEPWSSPEDEIAARQVQPFVTATDLERAARRVRGVHACRVMRQGDEPVPERIRVVVQGGRRLSVAKDIQSAWFTLWGLYVPRRLFVVTAVRSRADLLPERKRLQICQLRFAHDGDGLAAVVSLFWNGRVYEGQARVPAASDAVWPAAEATAAAVRGALPLGAGVELLAVRRLSLAGRDAVIVALAARGGTLMGIAQSRGNHRESAARAVLDATNRMLALAESDPAGRGSAG